MEGPRSGRFDRYRIYMIVNVVVSATISASNRCVVRIVGSSCCIHIICIYLRMLMSNTIFISDDIRVF